MKRIGIHALAALCGLTALVLLWRGVFPESQTARPFGLSVLPSLLLAAAGLALWRLRGRLSAAGRAGAELSALYPALDLLPDGVACFGADGMLVFANAACARLQPEVGGLFVRGADYEQLMAAVRTQGCPAPAEQGEHGFLDFLPGRGAAAVTTWRRLDDGRRLRISEQPMPGGGTVVTVADVSAETERDYLTYYDGLTALPNRALFRERLEQAIGMSQWRREHLAVIFLDLDNFQLINKGLGHERGDEVLRAVAERLGGALRHGDMLARLGGDKFALVQTHLRVSEQAALRTRQVLDLLEPPMRIAGRELSVSATAGIAVYPADGLGAEALAQAADVALARAKAAGRNRYHFYVEGMTEETRRRCELEHDITPALQHGEFLLHYQPQIDLSTGRYIGCEALMRWQHPRLGLLLPDQFIPIAEETGAIVPLGEWCLKRVCAQMAEWRAAGQDVRRVAINLSPLQFSSPRLVESVAEALDESGVPPQCLELEITESAAVRDPDHAARVLMHLNELGVHSVIDDFGTGYSSLSLLKRFPVYSLKVDQSFVTGLADGGGAGAIVSAVIDLGHSLNMRVTAEGIENQAQIEFLKEHRCDYGQGHSFARALPAEELPAFAARTAMA